MLLKKLLPICGLTLVATLVFSCCNPTYIYKGVVPIREECERVQVNLPLDAQGAEDIREFSITGRNPALDEFECGELAGQAGLPGGEMTERILTLLNSPVLCTYSARLQLPAVADSLSVEWLNRLVVDSRLKSSMGAEYRRRAIFTHANYNWIFYLKKNDTVNAEITRLDQADWRYSTLIVQRDFAAQGER